MSQLCGTCHTFIIAMMKVAENPTLAPNVHWEDKDINTNEFDALCEKTLKIYFSDAGWYNIPPTLHKVLVHGREIIEATPVAIGITSEEGSESNIKFARRFYKHHTRKNCQGNTMYDLFHRLMDVSDPIILSKQCIPKQLSARKNSDGFAKVDSD